MPFVISKSAIISSAVFVCANANTNSTKADVTTTDGFSKKSLTALRVGHDGDDPTSSDAGQCSSGNPFWKPEIPKPVCD